MSGNSGVSPSPNPLSNSKEALVKLEVCPQDYFEEKDCKLSKYKPLHKFTDFLFFLSPLINRESEIILEHRDTSFLHIGDKGAAVSSFGRTGNLIAEKLIIHLNLTGHLAAHVKAAPLAGEGFTKLPIILTFSPTSLCGSFGLESVRLNTDGASTSLMWGG